MTKSQIHNLLAEITEIVFERRISSFIKQCNLDDYLREKGVEPKEVIQVVQEDVSHPNTRNRLLEVLKDIINN